MYQEIVILAMLIFNNFEKYIIQHPKIITDYGMYA